MRVLLLFLFLAGCAAMPTEGQLSWRKLDKPIVITKAEQIRYMAGRNDTKTYYFRYEVAPTAIGYDKLDSSDKPALSKNLTKVSAKYLCRHEPYRTKMSEGYTYAFFLHKENLFEYPILRFDVTGGDCQ